MATIVILEHEAQRNFHPAYLTHIFENEWRASGHRVLVHHGHENAPSADIAILHVDLTVIPAEYRALIPRYERVVNGSVLNIGKSTFSQCLLDRDEEWDGPVIVKTEANAVGLPERGVQDLTRRAGPMDRLRGRLFRNSMMIPGPGGPMLRNYRIYACVRDVPRRVWTIPGLLVEKFVPEQDRHGYYLRVWTFFGNRERSTRYRSAEPLIKFHNVLDPEPVPVPDEIRAWRERLGFDYGKFDYVCPDGRPLLLDANRTPTMRLKPSDNPELYDSFRSLAAGLEAFAT